MICCLATAFKGILCLATGMKYSLSRDLKISTPRNQPLGLHWYQYNLSIIIMLPSNSIQKHSMPSNGYEELF